MEHKISETTRRFLSGESQAWVDEALISPEQRAAILESYTVTKRLPVIVLALGVLMIGIGLLSFIAANWDVLPSWLKMVMIVGSYLGSVVAAYRFERRRQTSAAHFLLFLSGFLLLGGLALISQIFHIQGNPTDLLATWLWVYAPTFILVRSLAVYLLYEAVGVLYLNMLYFDIPLRFPRFPQTSDFFDVRALFSPYPPLLVTAFLVGVAWWVWSDERTSIGSGKVGKFFVGRSSARIVFSNFVILNCFTWICVINGTGRTLLPFFSGVLLIGVAILVMARKLGALDLDWQGLLCVGVSGIALSFPQVWDSYPYGERLFETLLSSVLFGAALMYRIVRRRRSGFAVFLFCLLLARWYFDMFYSFMSKSFFFTLGGVLLLLLAFFYRRWNKSGAREASGTGDDDA